MKTIIFFLFTTIICFSGNISAQTIVNLNFASTELQDEISDGKMEMNLMNVSQTSDQLKANFKPYEKALILESLECENGNCQVVIGNINNADGAMAVRWLTIAGAREITFTDKKLSPEEFITEIRKLN